MSVMFMLLCTTGDGTYWTPAPKPSSTFAPISVFMSLAVHATIPYRLLDASQPKSDYAWDLPPSKPQVEAPIMNQRLPNLSEIRPKRIMEMESAVDHMIANRLELGLGPMSALMFAMMAAAGEKPQ